MEASENCKEGFAGAGVVKTEDNPRDSERILTEKDASISAGKENAKIIARAH